MRLSNTPLLAAVFALGVSSLSSQIQPTPPKSVEEPANKGSKFGVNLAEFTYYTPEVVFADLFKGSAEWIPQLVTGGPWNTGAPISQRPDGYPASLAQGQAVATLLMSGVDNYPGGPYVVLWDGDGDLEVRWDANVNRTTSNRIECFVRPSQGILLRIVRTNPADPVRNIRFVSKSEEGTYRLQPLQRTFLERWRVAKTLRFMDWQKTNSTYASAWADRCPADYYTQCESKGMSPELMIDVCNALDADGWFCMPHLCTDDYARQFARVVRNRLKPGLKAYVEYSNECWNGSFVQARYCREMGVNLQLSTDEYEAQLRYYSQRSVEIFAIWQQELGLSRIVRTLAGQNVNTWGAQVIMDWRNANQNADAWAVNAYFGHALGDPVNQVRVQNMTPQAILAECAQDIVPAMAFSAQHKALAQTRNMALVAFEAGQHMVGFGSAAGNYLLADKLNAANRLPAVRQMYDAFLTEWRRIGGGMTCLFNTTSKYGLYGSWGMFEGSLQAISNAPKYLGVMDFTVRNWNLP